MSNEFKKKLEAYERGELSGPELEAFELELDKLEKYQEYLQEHEEQEGPSNGGAVNDKKQKKILRRGKWRARFQTAFMALSLFVAFTILTGILSNIYYSWGKPDRIEVFRNIVDHTLTVTNPYGYLGGTSASVKTYFRLEATRDLSKVVGHDRIKVGELSVNFLFSMMALPKEQTYGSVSQDRPAFTYPGTDLRGMSDWGQLEKLPEGTVTSAYLSFSKLLETKEVLDLFATKNMDLLWLAVDTGREAIEGIVFEPIGFPSLPIWHDDDFTVTHRTEVKNGWMGGKAISQGAIAPAYQAGDEGALQEQFMKTLAFLERHERRANKLVIGKLQLAERTAYLQENGFHHYGAVVTGPTKEILKLRDEEWAADLEIDEVAFWNWAE